MVNVALRNPIKLNINRSSRPVLACKKVFLQISQNSQENTKKEIPAQMFSCEFCKISYKIFLKNPQDGCYCINTPSVYCRTQARIVGFLQSVNGRKDISEISANIKKPTKDQSTSHYDLSPLQKHIFSSHIFSG